MPSDVSHPSPPEPAKGLPPVIPPTAGHLVQMFGVPLLIVAGVVLVCMAGSWLAFRLTGHGLLLAGPSTPEAFLENLDNSNPDVRWRGAESLAQVLPRDERLASDPRFALDLAERLRRGLEAVGPAEEAYAERLGRQPVADDDGERLRLETDRNYLQYLMACLSDFTVPVGMPLLRELADKPDVAADADARVARREDRVWASRRREALWALTSLGQKLSRFDQLPEERKQELLGVLEGEAAGSGSERAEWARTALALLQGRQSGQPRLLGLDATFSRCAADADPFLRKTTALALNFWEGDAAENARLDDLLAGLAGGEGRTPDDTEVRYNAALALARRGSDRVRLDLLRDLLDEDKQLQAFRPMRPKDSPEVARSAVNEILVFTLKAVAELHRKRPDRDLSSLYPPIEALARSPTPPVRAEAERTLDALGKK